MIDIPTTAAALRLSAFLASSCGLQPDARRRTCRSPVCSQIALLLFVFLLLLIAKGYTITRSRLSPATSSKLAVFMIVFTLAHFLLIIWEIAVGLSGVGVNIRVPFLALRSCKSHVHVRKCRGVYNRSHGRRRLALASGD